MHPAPSYPFCAEAEITDLASQTQLKMPINKLSLFGCDLSACHGLQQGANVRMKLAYDGVEISVLGKVVCAQPELAMGVAFTTVEARDERVLCGWIAKLASQQASIESGQCDDSVNLSNNLRTSSRCDSEYRDV
jgi:hypothetical protein